MQSKTLCFNKTLFRKDLTRFWPLWAVYAAAWLLMLPLAQFVTAFGRYARDMDPAELALELSQNTLDAGSGFGLVLGFVFGVLFAMALFSYLTAARSVGMFHSFPIRRECLFLTHYLAGAAVFTVVQVLAFGLAALVQLAAGGADWYALGVGLLGGLGQMLFFYSFGVFCAMFTGQILAIPVFYGVLNVLAYGLCSLVQEFASAFYFGYSGGGTPAWVRWLTPLDQMSRFGASYIWNDAGGRNGYEVYGVSVLGVYALAGLVLAALALAVYRRRASESAGDTVAVPWAKPVFLYGVAVCSALSLGQALYYFTWAPLMGGDINFPVMMVCAVLLGLVGYFAAAMLLRKSFKVVRAGWKGAAALTAALLVFGVCVDLDVLGVENRVPDPAAVESVTFYTGGQTAASGTITDQASIAKAAALQSAILAEKDTDWENSPGYLDLTYILKNGQRISRTYDIKDNADGTSQAAALYREFVTDPAIQRANLLQGMEGSRLLSAELSFYNARNNGWDYISLDAQATQTVYEAMVADVDAGHFGTTVLMDDAEWNRNVYANNLTIYYKRPDNISQSQYFTFSVNCTYLIAALEEVGAVDEDHPLVTNAELWPEEEAGLPSAENEDFLHETLDQPAR